MDVKNSDIQHYMEKAFALAEMGGDKVSPDPLVGAVVVKNGVVIAEAYHQSFGCEHAEFLALSKFKHLSYGSDLYVNLEPCAHMGKNPPCVQSIIQAGIKRVFVAMQDPNPIVYGLGIDALRQNNIEVITPIFEEKARDINKVFIKHITTGKPYVTLKFASSMDGKTAFCTGTPRLMISNSISKEFVYKLRSQYDAILVGANTIRKDNPLLTSHGFGKDPTRIVIARNLNIKQTWHIFSSPIKTLIFTSHASCKIPPDLPEHIEFIFGCLDNDCIHWDKVLNILYSFGIFKLLVEGGSFIATSLLQEKKIDDIYCIMAPMLVGGHDSKTIFMNKILNFSTDHFIHLRQMDVQHLGDNILMHAYVL